MPLFESKIRTLEGPAEYNADIYKYYNDSARIGMASVRELLELWFEKYPEDEESELNTHFKVTFNAAFYDYLFSSCLPN